MVGREITTRDLLKINLIKKKEDAEKEELMKLFVVETKEKIKEIEETLKKLKKKPSDSELMEIIFRGTHSLAGILLTLGNFKAGYYATKLEQIAKTNNINLIISLFDSLKDAIAEKKQVSSEDKASEMKKISEMNKKIEEIERKKKIAEEKIEHEKELLQVILNSIPFGMDIVDEDLNIVYINKIFLSIFGKKSIGKKCYRVYKDNKKQCEKCPLKKPIKIGESRTIITSGIAGGKTFKIVHTGFKLPNGKKVIIEFFEEIK